MIAILDKLENTVSSSSVLQPAQNEVIKIYASTYKLLPYLASAFILLLIFILMAYVFRKSTESFLKRRHGNPLLIKSIANIVGIAFLILGFYFALKASGLSTLAVTLLGGTGMVGIGLGLALRSTFENYTSSIMISMRELLRMGELVSINGFEGVVQSVTTRGTTLMDYEGNNIIIPNTDVFNSPIKNLTRNPKMRADFAIGIGYEDSIDKARAIILEELKSLSKAVLNEPECIVAVDNLGAATVNLRVYFWFDAINISKIKVKSLVIQKVKEALVKGEISLPDDAREVVFASPLQIEQVSSEDRISKAKQKVDGSHPVILDIDLENEVKDIQKQAAQTPKAEAGENLI